MKRGSVVAKSKRGKHTSVRGIFQRSVEWLEGLEGVRKVILGSHKPCHHSLAAGVLVFTQNIKAGIKIRGYTDVGVMDIFLILESPGCREPIKQTIGRKFPAT
ncbi:MAG: hypothetical protein HYT38_00605 [Candidatus Sungbacteria bacterium]|uniref:Uncharacterized protein n=1 Tax=Candidatus Sungiibacteriota bacterium TaxID=2750080 RepID=A0A9D6DN69_9BACT|nr:hypothetical protein [Candidatus Sungbacteria bacterium]